MYTGFHDVYNVTSLVVSGNLDLDFIFVDVKFVNFKSIDFKCYFKSEDFTCQIQILNLLKIFQTKYLDFNYPNPNPNAPLESGHMSRLCASTTFYG